MDQLRLVCISDTHGYLPSSAQIPTGDVLIHAGDWTSHGTQQQTLKFLHWFAQHPHKHKILIAGNHDLWVENNSAFQGFVPAGVTYLQDGGCTIEGLNFWGSPVQPEFFNWAFNRKRGIDIQRHWDLIPDETDVLITHGPAYGILDTSSSAAVPFPKYLGCRDLLTAVNRVKPIAHIHGHIHYPGGTQNTVNGTTHFNAALCDEQYKLHIRPSVFDISLTTKEIVSATTS